MTDKKSKDNKAPELRKRAEEARIENEERLRSIVEKSAAGYFFIDCDGHYKSVNTAWLRMHGYDSPEEVLGLSLIHI